MHIICLDCGASFLKGALMEDGKILRQEQWPTPAVMGDDILKSRQVEKLVSRVFDIISDLSEGVDEAVLAIANEMHGFLLARNDGSLYTDYISWQKEFGRIEVDGESSVGLLGQKNFQKAVCVTGMPLRSGLPSSNLLYLKRTGILQIEERLQFFTLGDYLLYRLSGKVPVCHPTNAAATGLYDLESGQWQPLLLNTVATNRIIFPQVTGAVQVMEFTLCGTRISALPALGDQQASLYGAGLASEGEVSFNLGTGAQVSSLLPRENMKELYGERKYQIRPYMEGRYIRTIPHLPSGRALNVYFRLVKSVLGGCGCNCADAEIWNMILASAANGQVGDLATDLSFFENSVTGRVTGSITNISETNFFMGNLFSSVFRQMGNNFLWAARELGMDLPQKIIFSGGVARKIEILRRNIQNGMGGNVQIYVAENETMHGLCKYAVKLFAK